MLPLDGLSVLDLSRVLAGPLCTMRLADLGARVIKVESPGLGDPTRGFGPPFVDGDSPYFLAYNRGKESIVLDFKSEVGVEILERLVARADILVDNFRAGVLDRIGLTARRIRQLNEDVLHVTITGYPQGTGRDRDPAFDLAIQAESGLLSMTGADGIPCRVPISLADVAAGLAATEGVLAALVARGRGMATKRVEVSLLESLCALFGYQAQSVLMTGDPPRALGHRHANLVPYRAFATSDGWMVLAVATDVHWQRLLAVAGVPAELARDEWLRNAGRVEGRDALEPVLEEAFRGETTAIWHGRLRAADVPIGVVRTLDEVLATKSVAVRELHRDDGDPLPMVDSPLLLDGVRAGSSLAPPARGLQTESILDELATSPQEREAWRVRLEEEGAI